MLRRKSYVYRLTSKRSCSDSEISATLIEIMNHETQVKIDSYSTNIAKSQYNFTILYGL